MLTLDCNRQRDRLVCHIAFLSKHGMHNKNVFCNFLTHPCPSYTLVKNGICTYKQHFLEVYDVLQLLLLTSSSTGSFLVVDFCILCPKCH